MKLFEIRAYETSYREATGRNISVKMDTATRRDWVGMGYVEWLEDKLAAFIPRDQPKQGGLF
jgi:hypothetical protein